MFLVAPAPSRADGTPGVDRHAGVCPICARATLIQEIAKARAGRNLMAGGDRTLDVVVCGS